MRTGLPVAVAAYRGYSVQCLTDAASLDDTGSMIV